MLFTDNYTIDRSNLRKTSDGYLVASSRVARTGIQIYSGKEMGRPDLEKVRVYRPEDEVFSLDSLRSYPHKPITLGHPPDPVNSSSWKDKARGNIGDEVARDGDFVRVPMILMDEQTVRGVEKDEAVECSMGYTCDVDWGEGQTPDGQTYDATQRNIRINHLAIVRKARGGSKLRVGDERDEWGVDLGDGEYYMDPNPWHDPDTGKFTTRGSGELVPTEGLGPSSETAKPSSAGSSAKPSSPTSIQFPEPRGSPEAGPSRVWLGSKREAKQHIREQRKKWARAKIVRHVHMQQGPARGLVRRALGLPGKTEAREIYEVRAERDGQNVGDYVVDEMLVNDEKCPECGYELEGDETECPKCGYRMEEDSGEHLTGDNEGEVTMPKTITVDGISCEMSDTAAQVVQKTVSSLEARVKDAESKYEEEKKKREEDGKKASTDSATLTTQLATKDAEIVTLKKQVEDAKFTPQQLDAMVAERVAVIDKGKGILGDKLIIDGKTVGDIRRQVVDSVLGDKAKGWNDAQVEASFGTLTADIKPAANGVNDVANGFRQPHVNANDKREAAYKAYADSIENAWKRGSTAAA